MNDKIALVGEALPKSSFVPWHGQGILRVVYERPAYFVPTGSEEAEFLHFCNITACQYF